MKATRASRVSRQILPALSRSLASVHTRTSPSESPSFPPCVHLPLCSLSPPFSVSHWSPSPALHASSPSCYRVRRPGSDQRHMDLPRAGIREAPPARTRPPLPRFFAASSVPRAGPPCSRAPTFPRYLDAEVSERERGQGTSLGAASLPLCRLTIARCARGAVVSDAPEPGTLFLVLRGPEIDVRLCCGPRAVRLPAIGLVGGRWGGAELHAGVGSCGARASGTFPTPALSPALRSNALKCRAAQCQSGRHSLRDRGVSSAEGVQSTTRRASREGRLPMLTDDLLDVVTRMAS